VRRPMIPLALALSVAVAVAGCSSKSTPAATPTPSTCPSPEPTYAHQSPVDWSGNGVAIVSGKYGDKPTVTFPKAEAPTKLEKKVVSEGSGPAVAKGDLLVADYFGEVWNGKAAFDNSYDRGQPVGFTIGAGKVIQGWDDALVGVKAGSRVLLGIPPKEGYGCTGNTNAGIKGTDAIVFVVDVVNSFPSTATADTAAVPQPAVAGEPTITGALATRPTIKIPAGLAKPAKQSTHILAKGSGALVGKELAIVQYEVIDWTGAGVASTWADKSPAGVNVGEAGSGGAFDGLVGVPIGSRVLILLPVSQGQGPYAVVVDVIATAKSAKLTAGG
jgi:peptidylprolyl isomerase